MKKIVINLFDTLIREKIIFTDLLYNIKDFDILCGMKNYVVCTTLELVYEVP